MDVTIQTLRLFFVIETVIAKTLAGSVIVD